VHLISSVRKLKRKLFVIIRIVKMEFEPEKVEAFTALFSATRNKITSFDGCKNLELLNSIEEKNIFFTYSFWESEKHLEAYRHSDLFKQTWAKTKILFRNKAEAWSVMKINN
jgi:autoinducer 2-degrading protein